jgi:integrase/recombinase XerD
MRKKEVGNTHNRKHTACNENASNERVKMTQAATLTQQQLARALEFARLQRHGRRNRAILLLTH